MTLRRARRWGLALLASLGLCLTANALWIPAKAQAAQILLSHSLDTNAPPWPWADTRAIARLSVPRLGVDQIVLQGTTGEALSFGPGWMETAPIIAGHRDTHFRWLRDVAVGDHISIAREGEIVHYSVERTAVVPATASGVAPAPGQIAFVTCYPFDAVLPGPERFVAIATVRTSKVGLPG